MQYTEISILLLLYYCIVVGTVGPCSGSSSRNKSRFQVYNMVHSTYVDAHVILLVNVDVNVNVNVNEIFI